MLGRALPSRNEQGEVVQWIGTYTDIHEHKLAQERVTQAQRLLRDNNEELTRVNVDLDSFIYSASHDLKGPITNIEGLLQALADELPIEARQRPAVVRYSGRCSPARSSVFSAPLSSSAMWPSSSASTAYSPLRCRWPPWCRVWCSTWLRWCTRPARSSTSTWRRGRGALPGENLRSVVYNLLSNALKYRAPERPARIQVRAYPDGLHLRLSVQDNGLGINPAGQRRLFGLFERLHTHVEGSGMGLFSGEAEWWKTPAGASWWKVRRASAPRSRCCYRGSSRDSGCHCEAQRGNLSLSFA
ncbi:MAG: ATP-binding protein [Hymenobacter sp.]